MPDRSDSVPCPVCDDEVVMGLPRGATIEAITDAPEPTLDDEFRADGLRMKRRENACRYGHSFFVYFRF